MDDNYIRLNPTDNMLRELKQAHNFSAEKRKALTVPEQELFINFLKRIINEILYNDFVFTFVYIFLQ